MAYLPKKLFIDRAVLSEVQDLTSKASISQFDRVSLDEYISQQIAAGEITATVGGSATLADGNYGDIVVSGGGTVINLAGSTITNADIAGGIAQSKITNLTTDLASKVDKPVAQTPGFVAVVDGTGNNVTYVTAPSGASPNSQVEVTAGTAVANKYVQPDTLKVELDKKVPNPIAQTAGHIAVVDGTGNAITYVAPAAGTTIVDNLTSTSTTSALSANQGKVLQDTKLTKNTAITAGTNTKITYDVNGLVTAGAQATAADIANVPAGGISATNVQTAINELDTEKISSTLANGSIWIGNGSNVATANAVTGDVTITNAGVTTVLSASTTQAGKVELATTAETETGTSTTLAVTPQATEATYIKKSLIDAKGDIIVGTADNTSVRLPVGTDGFVLTADSVATQGVSYKRNNPYKYIQTFNNTTDWTLSGSERFIQILAATHNCGIYPVVQVEEDNGGVFQVTGLVTRITALGNINIQVVDGAQFAGRIVVM